MPSKTVRVTVVRDGAMCFVPVPFDPKRVFGRVRAPVRVTLNGFTYRSTIASMGGTVCIPLRRSNREAARMAMRTKRVLVFAAKQGCHKRGSRGAVHFFA